MNVVNVVSNDSITLKITILGQCNVGKTTISSQYKKLRTENVGDFLPQVQKTMVADITNVTYDSDTFLSRRTIKKHNKPRVDGKEFDNFNYDFGRKINTLSQEVKRLFLDKGITTVKLNLWDTAGMDKFIPLPPAGLIRNSDVILICVDLDDKSSHNSIIPHLDHIKKVMGDDFLPSATLGIVGNKLDVLSSKFTNQWHSLAMSDVLNYLTRNDCSDLTDTFKSFEMTKSSFNQAYGTKQYEWETMVRVTSCFANVESPYSVCNCLDYFILKHLYRKFTKIPRDLTLNVKDVVQNDQTMESSFIMGRTTKYTYNAVENNGSGRGFQLTSEIMDDKNENSCCN